MTNPLNLPNDDETIYSAADSDSCYEMEPNAPIMKVDCVFYGDAPFPDYMEDRDDD